MLSCSLATALHDPLGPNPPRSRGFFRHEYILLQGIFLTQGSNLHLLCLLHCRQILDLLSHQ